MCVPTSCHGIAVGGKSVHSDESSKLDDAGTDERASEAEKFNFGACGSLGVLQLTMLVCCVRDDGLKVACGGGYARCPFWPALLSVTSTSTWSDVFRHFGRTVTCPYALEFQDTVTFGSIKLSALFPGYLNPTSQLFSKDLSWLSDKFQQFSAGKFLVLICSDVAEDSV